MRRTKQLYSMVPPEIYKILQEAEPNISLYVYDLIAADLIKRGRLTVKKLIELKLDEDAQQEPPDTNLTEGTDANLDTPTETEDVEDTTIQV